MSLYLAKHPFLFSVRHFWASTNQQRWGSSQLIYFSFFYIIWVFILGWFDQPSHNLRWPLFFRFLSNVKLEETGFRDWWCVVSQTTNQFNMKWMSVCDLNERLTKSWLQFRPKHKIMIKSENGFGRNCLKKLIQISLEN